MNAPATAPIDPDLERLVAQRSADLAELLGHVSSCWDDERRLLARKMHDSLGSTMTALTMHLGLLAQQMPQDKALQDRAAQMKTLLMNVINANRDMQLALWNDKLEFLGIKAALSEVVARFNQEHPVKARLSLPEDDPSLPREHAVALLRCVEEGLRNVAAHSQAASTDIILDDNDEAVMLTVRDDGIGPSGYRHEELSCHGLRLLRERASYLGGTLSLQAGSNGGAQLSVILPKPGQQAAPLAPLGHPA